MDLNNYFLIGEIKAVANSAFVSITSFSDFRERFLDVEMVYIEVFGVVKQLFVEDAVVENEKIFLKFDRFDDPYRMDFLQGKKIYVHPDDAVLPDEDSWYIHDLIGSNVVKNEKMIGVINDVLVLSSNDVYEITLENGEELLIPAIDDYVDTFDKDKGILYLKPGEDQIYDDED